MLLLVRCSLVTAMTQEDSKWQGGTIDPEAGVGDAVLEPDNL